MFKDQNFKSFNVIHLKTFLYQAFIKKLIILREMEYKNIPIQGDENEGPNKENNIDLNASKSQHDVTKGSKMSKYYDGFKRPGFAEDGENLNFEMVILTTINYFWKRGVMMHPHIIFLCTQHMVNEYHLQIKQIAPDNFEIDYDAKLGEKLIAQAEREDEEMYS